MPQINVSPASATVQTTVSKVVATDVCGDLPPQIPVNIDCSLCNIGFPQAGGQISITFYGPYCPPAVDPSNSYWLGSAAKMAQWKCPNPGMDNEPNPNRWVATGYFSGVSGGSCAHQYKFEAQLDAIALNQITVSVTVYVLTQAGGNAVWSTYVSFSETLNETPSLDTTPYRSRSFQSPAFMPITVNQVGGKGDPVSFYKMTIGMESMRVGCDDPSVGNNAVPNTCGMWDGAQWYSCFRGFLRSTANTALREFTQLGFNAAGCGAVGGVFCNCDTITLTNIAPLVGNATYNNDPLFVQTYGILGIPGAVEAVGVVQQIQIAQGTSVGIEVVVKSINGALWICTNNNGLGWVCTVPNLIQAYSPFIMTANRAGFDVWLYALNFPNPQLLSVECYTPPAEGFIPEIAKNNEQIIESVAEVPTQSEFQKNQLKIMNRVRIPCVHLGELIPESNNSGCGACYKYKCSVHGECRKIDPSGQSRQCVTCEDYSNG